ncbi:PREDICTED: uncharacterized protein LOC107348102 [Acropora digitifera]|uniref:uncharacterized protein LOC107348102 n=1 Tax=Acropora digitifera TaxID=70779 RepID=UPI00077A3CD1|nr:PREDICTED: uncharacterized protein LOC107348102 [Acropora digitifera]
MNLMSEFIIFVLIHLIRRGSSKQITCKNGKFYEENVFAYLDCSLCTDNTHYKNCKTCCGSEISTTATRPERAQPVVKSSCGVEFFFQGKTLIAIVSSFIIGIIFILTVLGIVTLFKRYRRKSKSIDQPQPPIEETRAGVNSSTCVGLSVVQSDTNSEPL